MISDPARYLLLVFDTSERFSIMRWVYWPVRDAENSYLTADGVDADPESPMNNCWEVDVKGFTKAAGAGMRTTAGMQEVE